MTTDAVTAAYLAGATGRLGRAVEQVERAPELAGWGGSYLNRPLFLPERELRAFADDLQRLVGLLLSLPDRLFDGAYDRFSEALGVRGERGALMRRLGVVPPVCGRADVYHDGTAYRLLEIGIGSELGGWDRSGEVPRAYLRDDAFAAFAADHDLGYTHSPTELAAALRAAHPSGDDPVVALVEGPGALADWSGTWQPLRQTLRGAGLRCHLAELGDLNIRHGKVFLAGDRIDVVVRCFDTDQVLADTEAVKQAEQLFGLHRTGDVVLWTPLESNLFCEKAGLALLSTPEHGAGFSADERALIDRVVPWTRSLAQNCPDLIAECVDRREHLILKPSGGYGGYGVVPGWERTDAEWDAALRAGAADGAIVQERVVPRVEPVVGDDGESRPWHAVYGFFYTPTGFAGVHGRVAPARHSAVIGLTTNSTVRTAGVFHIRQS
jgi:hypothetical protein